MPTRLENVHPEIPPEDRVPFSQKFSYAMGVVSDHYAVYGLSALAMPVFNVLLGLSPTLVSIALALARLWDAITDPFVGSLSDNSTFRLGRRKPFILAGCVVTGLIFPLTRTTSTEATSRRAPSSADTSER